MRSYMRLRIPVAAMLSVLGAGWCSAADSSAQDGAQDGSGATSSSRSSNAASSRPSVGPSIGTSSGASSGTSDARSGGTAANDQQLSDQDFVKQTASAGLFEVKSSQLALGKSVPADERHVAEMMITDHQKANRELEAIAKQKGIAVAKTLQPEQQRQLDELQQYTGEQFAAQYAKTQLKAHDDAIALFEKASRELQDQDLKQFAVKTLPTLRQHREHVSTLPQNADAATSKGGQGQEGGATPGAGTDVQGTKGHSPSAASGSSSGSSSGSMSSDPLGDQGSTSGTMAPEGTDRSQGDQGSDAAGSQSSNGGSSGMSNGGSRGDASGASNSSRGSSNASSPSTDKGPSTDRGASMDHGSDDLDSGSGSRRNGGSDAGDRAATSGL